MIPGADDVADSWFTVWHLVVAAPPDGATERRLAALLAPDERATWRAARPGGRREELLVGRALLRACVGAVLGVEPTAVPLRLGPSGKPLVGDDTAVHANASHSGPHVVVAVTLAGPIGVDVEVVRPHPESVPGRFFSPDEQALLAAVPPSDRDRAFHRLWTVKEACIKAYGTGIRDIASMPATLAETGVAGDAHWQVVDLAPELAAAVAIRAPRDRGEVRAVRHRVDLAHLAD